MPGLRSLLVPKWGGAPGLPGHGGRWSSPAGLAELDSTIPAAGANPPGWKSVAPAAAPPATPAAPITGTWPSPPLHGAIPATAAASPSVQQPRLQAGEPWESLGAKPKIFSATSLVFTPNHNLRIKSSTPRHGYWYVVDGRRPMTCLLPPCELQLSNRFNILSMEDFPQLFEIIDKTPQAGFPGSATSSLSSHPGPTLGKVPPDTRASGAPRSSPVQRAPAVTDRVAVLSTAGKRHHKGRKSSPFHRQKTPTEAINRYSGGFRRRQLSGEQPPRSKHAPQQRTAPRQLGTSPHPLAADSYQSQSPCPCLPPTTLIVGDSIIRKVHFPNAIIHCFPGATVPVILTNLPKLLRSFPPSIKRVFVHVGTNDTTCLQSELTKKFFNDLFTFLKNCGKSVFVSGSIPTLSRGSERLSSILGLHKWLQSVCRAHNFLSFLEPSLLL